MADKKGNKSAAVMVVVLMAGLFGAMAFLFMDYSEPGEVPRAAAPGAAAAGALLRPGGRGASGAGVAGPGGAGSSASDGPPAVAPATPTTKVAVRVLGPKPGVPAVGATVVFETDPVAVTGADGRAFIDFPDGPWTRSLFARLEDFSSAVMAISVETLPPGELTLTLRAQSKLSVQVVDKAGRPQSAANVWLLPGVAAPGATDATGHFDFGSLPAGSLWVFAEGGEGAMRQSAQLRLELRAGASRSSVLVLTSKSRIFGTVQDEAGVPQPEIAVEGGGEGGLDRARSRNDGSFRLDVPRPGPVVIRAHGGGRTAVYRGPWPKASLTLTLKPASRLLVKLHWSDGEPVLGAQVRVSMRPESAQALGQQQAQQNLDLEGAAAGESVVNLLASGDPGDYRGDGLEPGPARVELAASGENWPALTQTVKLVAGEQASLELSLPAEDMQGTIEGSVQDAQSAAPVAGAEVLLLDFPTMLGADEAGKGRTVLTDARGHFAFGHVDSPKPAAVEGSKADPYGFGSFYVSGMTLKVQAQGYASWLDIVDPQTPAEIKLTPVWTLGGRVLDEAGLPLALVWADGQELDTQNGRFETWITQETPDLVVGSPGYAARHFKRAAFVPAAGNKIELGELRLKKLAQATVRVLDPKGQPLPGAQVFQRVSLEHDWSTRNLAATDEAGELHVPVPAWPVLLEARHPAFIASLPTTSPDPSPRATTPAPLQAGAHYTLRLRRGAYVRGDAGGPGRLVQAFPRFGKSKPAGYYNEDPEFEPSAHGIADAAGHFRLGPLFPARWRVVVTKVLSSGGTERRKSADLPLRIDQETQLSWDKMTPMKDWVASGG